MWLALAIMALTAGAANAEANSSQDAMLACANFLRLEAQGAEKPLRDQLLADAFLFEKAAQGLSDPFVVPEGFVAIRPLPKTASDCQFGQARKP
jgi:hypothetical protein